MAIKKSKRKLWLSSSTGQKFSSLYGHYLGQTGFDFSRAWELTAQQARNEGWDVDMYTGLIGDGFEMLSPLLQIILAELLKPKKKKASTLIPT